MSQITAGHLILLRNGNRPPPHTAGQTFTACTENSLIGLIRPRVVAIQYHWRIYARDILSFYTFAHTIAPKITNKLLLSKIFLSRLNKFTIIRSSYTTAFMFTRLIKTKSRTIEFCPGRRTFNTSPPTVESRIIKWERYLFAPVFQYVV